MAKKEELGFVTIGAKYICAYIYIYIFAPNIYWCKIYLHQSVEIYFYIIIQGDSIFSLAKATESALE